MNNIKVSVILPVYKVPLEYLRDCLDSLIAQTLRECEFIMVSDGAPEAECSVCEEYVARDSRFKFFKCEHAGVSVARNFGIRQAQGEYTSFVDSDDWIDANILKEAYDFSKKNDSDVTFWNCVTVSNKKKLPVRYSTMDKFLLSEESLNAIKRNLFFAEHKKYLVFIYPVCKLYKASLVKNFMFEENLEIGEDRIFNMHVFSKDIRVAYLNRSAYFYRQNADSITKKYRHDAFDTLMKYVERMKELSNGMYHAEICNEILYKFVESLSLDYYHKDNPYPSKDNIKRLKQVFYSEDFRNVVKGCNFRKLNRCHKIDYLFIRFKFIPWLYIRTKFLGLKNRLF
ncbi:MAG: glycosyltransferase [Fibrobacter sp.]|nr:glycosyltransferase [Fibrobacter sp.]